MEATEDRKRNMRDAIHSVAMEGGEIDQETQEQMAAYARGETSAEQLHSWVLEHARKITAEGG